MNRRTPLWLWTAALAALVPLVVVGLVLAVAAISGEVTPAVAIALGATAAASATAVGVVVGVLGGRIAASIAEVRLQALTPAAGTARPGRAGWLSATGTRELSTLSAAVASLHERLDIADEVSQRARRSADDAGSGVFRLLTGLVAAEEGARGQLAAELHDTVAQSLLAARQLLAVGDTEAATEQVEDAEDQVRGLMARTRPPELRDGDLAQAVSFLSEDLHRRYGLRIHPSWPATPRPLPLATAIVTYRFFQEALLNVIKHAEVDDATVSLAFTETGLIATVSDAGDGFAPEAVAGVAGRQVGLSLLRERARLAGGSVRVISAVGASSGTCVELVLPVQRPPVARG